MNEFLEQFLIESRELVEQATDDLLALEERPEDGERLDSVFRAFHTLKGAAGIMDFEAMGRALHAAEDVLSSARAAAVGVGPALVSDCLICLDQVVQWLDTWEAEGAPPANADAAADGMVRRFAAAALGGATADAPADETWADALVRRHPAHSGAGLAIRYTPDPDGFYQGEDPLTPFEQLPGLVALELEPMEPRPALGDMDPFVCHTRILAVFREDSPQHRERLGQLPGQLQVARLAEQEPVEAGLSRAAAEIIRAQVLMLEASAAPDGLAGRLLSAARSSANVLRWAARGQQADRLERLARSNTSDAAALVAALEAILAGTFASGTDSAPAPHGPTEISLRGVRVEIERVDALVALAGELTVAKNALGHAAHLAAREIDPAALPRMLREQHAQLDRLVAQLQRAVLNMRVLPLRHVFQRLPRLVREMVVALDKPARLVTEGDATEADKAVVENLFEPLLHVLRNALDHGVENAAQRAAAGKPPSATLTVRARREGDQVVVEVQDDGRGLDLTRIRETAVARGLLSAEALEAMPATEVMGLIFAPGFSTAAEVTSVSGRGVGMDAVRSAIDRLGGRVTVQSEAGAGALVRFTLPFTVMMSRVMTVKAGGQLFGVPLEAVVETLRLPRERIVAIGAGRAFVLRDRTIPLIDLGEALGKASAASRNETDIVVATTFGLLVGLEVEGLGERMDVMLKPLGGLLAGTPGVAGATLLGDGRVLLVLDLQELLQ